MTELTKFTIFELKEKITKGEITASEVTESYLQAIAQKNPKTNAYVLVTEEKAKQQAATADSHSILAGAPIGIKDNYCNEGITTSCCSKILETFVPTYESTVTANLFQNGAVMLGKCNMDEFAMGSTNKTSYKGKVQNPLRRKSDDDDLVPGGSSGGSAAAVAAGLAVAAIGSDTGGSIRQPASFTGLVGIKPSYGRCSRWGLVAFASSLDQAGPITKDVRDAALMLEAMAGFDPKDSTSVDIPVPQYSNLQSGDLKGVRVGIPKEYKSEFLNGEIQSVWERTAKLCEELGATVKEISLPHTAYAAPTYYILNTAEASSNLARFDGVRYGLRVHDEGDSLDDMYAKTRGSGFGAEVKSRIMLGTYVLSSGYYDAYYKKAQQVRRLISQDFKNAFAEVDVILTPTTPKYAYKFDEAFSNIETYLNDAFTVSANIAGIPAISLPAGMTNESLPIGIQLMSAAFTEDKLLQYAYKIEQALGFDRNNLIYRI